MAKLLYIQGSPRGQRSYSNRLARAFLKAYQEAHPKDTVNELDLFGAELIPFDAPAVSGKYRILHGQEAAAEEKKVWKEVKKWIEGFKKADKYVFSVPMWNFGVPYRVKQYLDVLIQPGYTFSYSQEKGYEGLVVGKKAFVAYARGGEYAEGTEAAKMDFQRPYLEAALGFMGITEVCRRVVEPTLSGGEDLASAKLEEAIGSAKGLAKTF